MIRQAADIALHPHPEWLDQLHGASLSGDRMREIADDPVLAESVKRSNLAIVLNWAQANLLHPGRRVAPDLGPETVSAVRDLARRGLDEASLDAYRTTHRVVWNRCMEVCFALTDDREQLRELLELASLSISTYVEDTIEAVSALMQAERAELTRGAQAELRATVALLLEGAPIRRVQAEDQLGYRLSGPHTAAIVWASSPSVGDQLETAAELLMKISGVGHRLTIVAGAAALWLWLPADAVPELGPVHAGLTDAPDVRIALGRTGVGVDGFRRSHLDALEVQRMLARLPAARRVARHDDVHLVSVLTSDPLRSDEFVADTLGGLASADPDVITTVITYLEVMCSTTRAAERLFTHRNTVVRRLALADQLLPRPLASNPVAVGAALDVLRWAR